MANPDDHVIASRIATEAGQLLLDIREQLFAQGADSWTVKDTGDLEAHRFIVAALEDEFPEDGILSEEGKDDLIRLDKDRVWIVDPLDGTREFGEQGRSDWAVHVALTEGGVPTAVEDELRSLRDLTPPMISFFVLRNLALGEFASTLILVFIWPGFKVTPF